MNVLHININYSLRPLHQELIRALNRYGVNNTVFLPMQKFGDSKVLLDDYVIQSECFEKKDRYFYKLKQRKILNACKREITDLAPKIIHAHTLFTDGNVAMHIAKEREVPYVVAVRNTDVNVFFKYRPWLIPLGIKIMRNAKSVVFLSESYKRDVIYSYIPKKFQEEIIRKASVIPNGIDKFWLDNINNSKDYQSNRQIELLSVCEVDKNKNIFETIKAVKILKDKGIECHLTVIGRAKEKRIVTAIQKESFVDYYSPKPKEELIKYYHNADIFVMPSHTESFGLVYAEALSQGLPVLYTRGQGFDGQFNEGEVGYPISDENPRELAEAIVKVCDEYKRMSDNAVRGCEKFSWSLIAKEYIQLYGGIVLE